MNKGDRFARESLLQRWFIHCCIREGWYAVPTAQRNTRGFPDVLVFFGDRRVCLVELKLAGGRLSKLQEVTIAKLRKYIDVDVVYDYDGAVEWFNVKKEM